MCHPHFYEFITKDRGRQAGKEKRLAGHDRMDVSWIWDVILWMDRPTAVLDLIPGVEADIRFVTCDE